MAEASGEKVEIRALLFGLEGLPTGVYSAVLGTLATIVIVVVPYKYNH